MTSIEALIAIAAAATLVYAAWVFNRLVSLRARARGAWSDIDVQLKRRWDLVPSLVETVRGYAAHESQALEAVTGQRAEASRAEALPERARAETELSGGLARVTLLAEAYPDLKADGLYASLHEKLVEVEDHLQSARRYYNAVTRDLNTRIDQFPSSIVARLTGIRRRDYFEIEDATHRSAPRVDLGGD
jgi:LemA protein